MNTDTEQRPRPAARKSIGRRWRVGEHTRARHNASIVGFENPIVHTNGEGEVVSIDHQPARQGGASAISGHVVVRRRQNPRGAARIKADGASSPRTFGGPSSSINSKLMIMLNLLLHLCWWCRRLRRRRCQRELTGDQRVIDIDGLPA